VTASHRNTACYGTGVIPCDFMFANGASRRAPEVFEPGRREFRVTDRVLD